MRPHALIVGAGPVGLTAASELTRFGVTVRIVDKNAQRTDKSKALVLWSRSLELLDRGPKGSAPFIEAGLKAVAVNFVAGDGERIGRVTMDSVRSPHPYGLMIPQSETERLLEERLENLGVSVERQVEVLGFKETERGVEATLRYSDGREGTAASDWLLGCDGAHSVVRQTLASPFSGETLNSDWILADVHLRGYPFPDNESSVYWHKDGVFVIFPISPGRYRAVADLPLTAGAPPEPTLEQVQAIMDRRGPKGLTAFDPIWLSSFRINSRKVANYRSGRVFLLGDAAHIHSPAGGQGMNTGMQDAFNLAWKLALVIRKACGDRLLDTYNPERSGVGDEVLKQTARLTAIATVKNSTLQSIRNLVGHFVFGLTPAQRALADSITEVAIGYPESPLNGSALGPPPKPGERLVPLSDQESPGSNGSPQFALFAKQNEATADLVRQFERLLDPNIRAPLEQDGIWLVRPDGYVACSANNLDVVADYLSGVSEPSMRPNPSQFSSNSAAI